MKRILFSASLAAALGITAGAQAPANPASPSQANGNASQTITINGCVYKSPDDAMFALERTPDADATGTQPSAARPADQANVRGATGTSGTTTLSPGGAAGTGTTGPAPATWYRLASGPAAGFGEFAGKAVRIRGTVAATSADSPRGAGNSSQAGTRSIEPAQIPDGVPAGVDLKTAPQLIVQDITAVEGQCRAAAVPPSR